MPPNPFQRDRNQLRRDVQRLTESVTDRTRGAPDETSVIKVGANDGVSGEWAGYGMFDVTPWEQFRFS